MLTSTTPIMSVLVAAYNVEKMIDRCMQSLISQSMQDIEIIVVDDGSTDETGNICEKYSKLDNRVKIIHHSKNKGLPMARKTGLKSAKGHFIKFVDSDDWCEPNMCECLYKIAVKQNADIVFCSAYRHREDGVAKICNLPLNEGLYRKEDLYDNYILPLYGDLKNDKLYITDEILYHYNRGTNTMSKRNSYWEGYWDNMVAVFLAKKKYGKKLFKTEQEYMYRLVTTLYLKFFRSIRNETHYDFPCTDTADMYYGTLPDRVRFFQREQGGNRVYVPGYRRYEESDIENGPEYVNGTNESGI